MDAYDTAVLSYALATAANKIKPGLLGLAPNIGSLPVSNTQREDVSLTPPTKQEQLADEDAEKKNYFVHLLSNVQHALLNKFPIQLSQMIEICSYKHVGV